MASSTINIKIKELVEGKDQVKSATLDLRDLAGAADKVKAAFRKSNPFNALMVNAGACSMALQGLQSSLSSLSEGYNSFDQSMRAANTMAGKGAEEFGRLKDQITELSKTVPLAREELANGLYQVISNGVPEDNWISYLQASAKSAVGGIADLGEVVKVTSTIIKNYGLGWESAMDVQDKIQLTAKLGVTSFEQLAAALPSVTGQAAQLGVSLDEMLAVMSTLTGVTGNTAEVSTQLASVLTALTKESSKSQKMAEAMGISFNAASIKAAGGFRNFLVDLDRAVAEYASKSGELKESIYSKLFGRAEALRLVNALTGELASSFDDKMSQMADSVGTIDDAFADMSKSATSKAQLVKNAWSGVTDLLGQGANLVKPFVTPLAQTGQAVMGINAIKGALLKTKDAALAAAASIKAMNTAMLMSRIGVAAIAITALAGGYYLLTQRTSEAERKQRALAKVLADVKTESQKLATEEITHLKVLYDQTQNVKLSMEQRLNAVNELKQAYPDYFSQISNEAILAGKAASEYEKLKENILATAKARGYETRIAQLQAQILENQQLRREAGYFDWYQKYLKASGLIPGAEPDYGTAVVAKKSMEIIAGNYPVAELQDQIDALAAEAAKTVSNSAPIRSIIPVAADAMSDVGSKASSKEKAEDVIPDFEEVKGRALNSLKDYGNAIKDLRAIEQVASKERLPEIRAWIAAVEEQQRAFEGAQAAQAVTLADVQSRQLNSIADIDQALRDLQELRDNAAFDEVANIQAIIDKLKEERNLRLGISEVVKANSEDEAKRSKGAFESIAEGWGSVKGVASGIQSLSKINDESASSWERVAGAIDGAMSIYQGVATVIKLLGQLGQVSTTTAAAQTAAAGMTTAAAKVDTNAQLTDAAAKALNAHSWVPFVGIALGAAAVATMIATMAGLPKFAEGGLAYGPTLGLFGEYSGASNNPEVVAPLDKLKDLIGDDEGGMPKEVRVRLSGRDLIGAIEVNQRHNARTR